MRGRGGSFFYSKTPRVLCFCTCKEKQSSSLFLCLDSPSDVDRHIFCAMGNSRGVEMSEDGAGDAGNREGRENPQFTKVQELTPSPE